METRKLKNGERKGAKRATRVTLADDDCGVRQSLRQLFSRDERFAVLSKHARAKDALKQLTDLPPDRQPDLVLLDFSMPGMDGIECCYELRERFPDLVIAMFTGTSARKGFEPARLAGADAYIVKGTATDQLVHTLRLLRHHDGECLCVDPRRLRELLTPLHPSGPLTPCEKRVVKLISSGLIQKEVASELGCSVRNVRKHLALARQRMGAQSLTHLIRLWVERNGGS